MDRCLGALTTDTCLFKGFSLAKVTAQPRKKTNHLLSEHADPKPQALPFYEDTPYRHYPTPVTYLRP